MDFTLVDYAQIALVLFISTYTFSLTADLGRQLFETLLNFWHKESDGVTFSPNEIAFVIPCHNSADVIEGTINSLPSRYLIFCVTNACTDNTIEVIKKLQQTKSNIVLIEAPVKGKIRAVLYGVDKALKSGCSHFMMLDDDVEWLGGEDIKTTSKDTPCVALPVLPTQPSNWIQGAQMLEYEMMVVSKRAQSFFGNVVMASGAAGIYKIDVFLETMKYHDGEHIGDDFQCSYLHHLFGKKIDFYNSIVLTHTPDTFKIWWRQRAKRWEASPIHNGLLISKILFLGPGKSPGFWIKIITSYRIFVFFNDLARLISFPVVLATTPHILIGVWGITYASMVMRAVVYQNFFRNHLYKADKVIYFTFLTYPLYGVLTWLSRLAAIPKGIKQLWLYHVKGYKQVNILKPLIEELCNSQGGSK